MGRIFARIVPAFSMETLRDIEKVTKALANRRRLAILGFLRKAGSANVGAIAKEIRLSLKATSKHMAILRAANLVEGEQVSLSVIYRLRLPFHRIAKTATEGL